MPRTDNLYELPRDLPAPTDDGACAHLTGMRVPRVALPSTEGPLVDLSALSGRTVVYCYFPPDIHAAAVVHWLIERHGGTIG